MKMQHPISLVGDTPLVNIGTHGDAVLWAKLEGQNPTGSLKDRTASALVQKGIEENGVDCTFIDASSGSYACALAYFSRIMGAKCVVVVNSKISGDNLAFLKAQGAEVVEHGTVTGESRERCTELIAQHPDWIFTDQLTNPLAPQVHENTTAVEIFRDLENVTAVVGSKGSGATLCGVSRYVKNNSLTTRVFGSIGIPGDEKKIAGTYSEGVDFVSPFIQELDELTSYTGDVPVKYADAMRTCLELPCLVGPQGGGVYLAATRAIDERDLTGDVVLIMGDTMLKNVSRFT
tara:strand:+ start:4859 stop:5728 length:870 start_codon:yes stop_codon:yes gene_type:complete